MKIETTEDVEAIVRRVLVEELAKQHGSSKESARSHTSGEKLTLNLEDFELPDDLGSMFTAVTLPNEIKDDTEKEKGDCLNDADTADPDSLCDEARDKIGDLEQKLALANASNEMFEKEIRRLKSIIEGQSGEIDRLVEAKKKDQAHLEAESSDYRRKWIVLFEEKYMLEEKLARQKKELATLNKKVELAVLNKKALSAATSNKDGNGSGLDLLMAKIERQKKELARLNKQVEKKNNSACLAGPF